MKKQAFTIVTLLFFSFSIITSGLSSTGSTTIRSSGLIDYTQNEDGWTGTSGMYRYSVNYNGLDWWEDTGGVFRDLDTQFTYIKNWGFDTVSWQGDFGCDDDWIDSYSRIPDFYEACQENGLKLLVSYQGESRSSPCGGWDAWIGRWVQIAEWCPTDAVFDLFHEPQEVSLNEMKQHYEDCIDAIREYSENPIIVYPPELEPENPWMTFKALRDSGWEIECDNVYYAITCLDYSTDDSYMDCQTYEEFYQLFEDNDIIWALDNGFDVVVADTSCGPDEFNAGANKVPYLKIFLELLSDLNIPWNVWSWGTEYLNLITDVYGTPSVRGQAFRDAM